MTEAIIIKDDKITATSLRYIENWRLRKELMAALEIRFGGLEIGELFTLPGGRVVQEKAGETLALAGSQLVGYRPWERVVRYHRNGNGAGNTTEREEK